ncbi:hypothetical protein GA0061102_101888 [Rhizobium miluonense]|uniref:Uncharacterized protein n=1 Tax=Rhizobium miluonense TaxID=411945 RepID=A0A1C3VVX3_9HYPH|nr:hypothetical protein GA0061102_101888 [Rhizobium miluonense]
MRFASESAWGAATCSHVDPAEAEILPRNAKGSPNGLPSSYAFWNARVYSTELNFFTWRKFTAEPLKRSGSIEAVCILKPSV